MFQVIYVNAQLDFINNLIQLVEIINAIHAYQLNSKMKLMILATHVSIIV